MKAKGLSRRLLRMGLVLVLAITLVGMSLTPALASPRWGPADNEETGGHGHQHDGDHGKAWGHHFEDSDEAEWAADIIEEAFEKGFIKGIDAKHFQPNKPVTRVEAAIMITRLLGLEEEALQSLQVTLPFLDADEVPSWARGYVDLMVAQEIMRGIETGHGQALQGMKPATRLEVTVMLIRALGLEEQAMAHTGATLTFTDLAAIPPSLLGYVALAVEKGIVTGANNTFQPNKPVTRAEMAAMLDRASGKVNPSG
ncbi:MAG TPA: S-layer homology domain-containing protein, partial [Bacillota bacterium]